MILLINFTLRVHLFVKSFIFLKNSFLKKKKRFSLYSPDITEIRIAEILVK